MKTVIYNAYVLTMNESFDSYPQGMIMFDEHMLTYVGEFDATYLETADEVIDAQGKIVMPGFVNTHAHIPMIPFRSLGDDCPDRLRRYLFPLESECMTASLVYHASRYAILEMQRSGVTSFLDMYYFEEEVARASAELNMRGVLGETVLDFITCDTDKPFGGLDYGEAFINRWKNHHLITPIIAPHAPNTNTTESLQRAHTLAKKYDTMLTIHLAEMDYEMAYYKDNYEMTPVAYLNSIGVLDERVIAAHCIHVNEADMKLLGESSVKVAHCVGSNMKAGKGIAPVKEMLAHNIVVGLGTDGASSGNTLDLFTQMKLVPYAQKTKYADRSIFHAKDVVKLATLEGAKVLGLDKVTGSLEVGKYADVITIECDSLNMFPMYDPYSVLVYSANASNVNDVFIHGQMVLRDKKSVHDEAHIKAQLQESMQTFKKSAIEKAQAL